jgi:alkylation response protein AidB-like acyl-CoA dehydrogenase
VDDVGTVLGTDFVGLADEFGEEERDYLERTRRFVDEEVLPEINGFWERVEFPRDMVRRMGELGTPWVTLGWSAARISKPCLARTRLGGCSLETNLRAFARGIHRSSHP